MKELPPAFRTIPEGTPLVDALSESFGKRDGWLQAVGFVENVELKLAGEGADVRRTYSGRFALASLSGPVGGPYGVTLSRTSGSGTEILAGLLMAATSGGVSAVFFSLTGERLGAERAAAPAPLPAAAPVSAPDAIRPKQPPAGASSFAARVGVRGPLGDDDDEDTLHPERGDLVEHFAFGRAEVLSVDGERLVLRDLFGPGRIREIALDRLTVTGPFEHEGKNLYRLGRR